uniref:AlNc14C430G11585 protein n=1 Tax=Albugo laibachii Nc14 TaxID=890382 RepID=F0WZJ4_9STRA|nr:AlNc14C430G11585 [Albugo laibachii Nc14]|eukprot:CCA26918.1 AlNc14C430G11585 [Albugo laibachii Nc14]
MPQVWITKPRPGPWTKALQLKSVNTNAMYWLGASIEQFFAIPFPGRRKSFFIDTSVPTKMLKMSQM